MYYHYDQQTKEFLFESFEKVEDFPYTEVDIDFNLSKNRNQVFDGEKWLTIYDYRKENVYKKNTLIKVYKKLGEKINEDEEIREDDNQEIKKEISEEEKKTSLKLKINGFLSSTDKYFNGHPPKYKGDINKLKKYRQYLYDIMEDSDWYKKEIIEFEP